MAECKYYYGSDLKFQIAVSATGFSQDCDNYDIDIYSGDKHLSFNQDNVISSDGKFYLPLPSSELRPGQLRMVITAYVPDTDFEGGVRKEKAVQNLGFIKELLV